MLIKEKAGHLNLLYGLPDLTFQFKSEFPAACRRDEPKINSYLSIGEV
jgi:hypothetical protein